VSSEDLLLEGAAASAADLHRRQRLRPRRQRPKVVERLREAKFWPSWAGRIRHSPGSPTSSCRWPPMPSAPALRQLRVARAEVRAGLPAPPQVRPGVEALADLLSRFDPKWSTSRRDGLRPHGGRGPGLPRPALPEIAAGYEALQGARSSARRGWSVTPVVFTPTVIAALAMTGVWLVA